MDSISSEEKFIQISKGNIFAKIWTPKNILHKDVPLILMHDSLGCVEMWREFPVKLAENLGRKIIAYDRLGFGKSSKRQELPSIHFVKEESEIYLPEILNSLGVNQFILLGHSVGGGNGASWCYEFSRSLPGRHYGVGTSICRRENVARYFFRSNKL